MDTNNKTEATINFIYFANNFTHEQLVKAIETTSAPDHLFQKLKAMDEKLGIGNGTTAFFKWFMELSLDNQKVIVNWVNQNYSAFGSINPKEKYKEHILKGEDSSRKLTWLLENEDQWGNPENKLKGIHQEQGMFVVWDNTTGHCSVENYKKERNAIAWLNDEEV